MGRQQWIRAREVERLYGVAPESLMKWIEQKLLPADCWMPSATGTQVFYNLNELEEQIQKLQSRVQDLS